MALERLTSAAETGATYASVAYHGINAAILGRRISRREGRIDDLEHSAAFYEALGGIATHVAISEAGPGGKNDLPPKPRASETKHAFASQARYHELRGAYEASGLTNPKLAVEATFDDGTHRVDDTLLPAADRAARHATPEYTQDDMIDPRDPTRTIAPRTRAQRRAAKRVASNIHRVRSLRADQRNLRRMLGNSGPNHAIRTKLHHFFDRLDDNADVADGRISAFEALERKRDRGKTTSMEQGEWGQLTGGVLIKGGESKIKSLAGGLEKATVVKAGKETKKHGKKVKKSAKLEARQKKHQDKLRAARARI